MIEMQERMAPETFSMPRAALLNEMYLNGWTLADDGTIMAEAGDLPSTGTAKIIPVVRSLQAAPVRTMLSSEETVKAHIQDLTDLASRGNFAGGRPCDKVIAETQNSGSPGGIGSAGFGALAQADHQSAKNQKQTRQSPDLTPWQEGH